MKTKSENIRSNFPKISRNGTVSKVRKNLQKGTKNGMHEMFLRNWFCQQATKSFFRIYLKHPKWIRFYVTKIFQRDVWSFSKLKILSKIESTLYLPIHSYFGSERLFKSNRNCRFKWLTASNAILKVVSNSELASNLKFERTKHWFT